MSFPFVQPYFGLGNSLQTAQASGGAGGGSGIGGWVELARTTLGSAQTSITVSSLDNKRYYMVLCPITAHSAGGTDSNWRFNSDSGSNYSWRQSSDGNPDTTGTDKDQIFDNGSGGSRLQYSVSYIANLAGKEKLMMTDNVVNWVSGAGGDINRKNIVGKWDNTSDAINSITNHFLDGGGIANDELIVLGWDPTDDHTTNFWEELASVDLSGGAASSLDSGTILAKKYLWVQMLMEQTADSNYPLRFNSDSGSNYGYRYITDGGTEFTHASQTGMNLRSTTANLPVFVNMFIINRTAQDKLIIAHDVKGFTAGHSYSPLRTEQVGKWANTSAQITSIQLHTGSGNLATNTIMKVWGAD